MADTRVLEPRKVRKADRVEEVRIVPVELSRRPAYQAYRCLHIGFVVLPILAGLDKFFQIMTNWDMYLAGPIERMLPVSGHTFMVASGVVEIAAGLLVAILPRVGAWVVAGWLGGIVLNLLIARNFYDVALRDVGLIFGAVALGLLAREFKRPVIRKAPAID
jgi:hypothetical protein